jgi:hypothetical protein
MGMGLLLLLTSCDTGPPSRDTTEEFITGVQVMFLNAGLSESSMVLQNFNESNPPGYNFSSAVSLEGTHENLRALRDPFGLDSIYGTWNYQNFNWVHTDPADPADAILFTWIYTDTADYNHDARLRVDSLEFYEDTLPTKIWVGLGLDGFELAWLKFAANYISEEEADSVTLIYHIVNFFEMGASVATLVDVDPAIDSTYLDSTDFVGTVHLWADNLVTNYGVDFTVTRYANDSGRLTLEDSNGWDLIMDVSAPDATSYPGYERRVVEGAITRHGEHAASIEGILWDPEDTEHTSMVIVIFSDDTEGDYTYLGEAFEDLIE